MLLTGIVFLMGMINSHFTPERNHLKLLGTQSSQFLFAPVV
jgi:hypothetical protein